MEKIFNLTSTFKTHAEEDGSVMIRGMASTVDFDRAGDSISSEAWQKGGMANFEKNPIILFNHDYDKPIGRATGLKAGPNGLEMEAKISKHAHCAALIKDGVLGAFSVGFRVKDADYIKETDGLMIKDAELFEVSVVSVPCNQSATFSLAKSFDSTEEYEEFKKTFTNRVDLAGQSLAKEEVITSSVASDTPKSAEQSADQEIKMDNTQNIDLEAFAKKVADETAAKIAMKQAEQKAAEQAEAKAQAEIEAARTLEGEKIQATIKTGVENGVELLVSDIRKEFEAKEVDVSQVIEQYKADLEEKNAEIQAMNESKRNFSDRGNSGYKGFEQELLHADILGKITGKGWDTSYSTEIHEKLGATKPTGISTSVALDLVVATQFEEEVKLEQQVAQLFRELQVNSTSTVLPLLGDTNVATFSPDGINAEAGGTGDIAANMLDNKGATAGNFAVGQVILGAHRLVSGTYLNNDTDEQILVSLMPMLTKSLARAHAQAIDGGIILGNAKFQGLVGTNGTEGTLGSGATAAYGTANGTAVAAASIAPANSQTIRAMMGKYGINPSNVVFIVSPAQYFTLAAQADFADISQVGSDVATKLTGVLGSMFGSRVIVSDRLAGTGTNKAGIIAVNPENFIIPRLRGVSIETEYSAQAQRTALIATQSLGFARLSPVSAGNVDCAFIKLT